MKNDTKTLERIGSDVAEALGPGPPEDGRPAQERALLSIMASRRRQSRTLHLIAVSTAALLVVAAGATLLWSRPRALAFWIGKEISAGKEGTWLQAPPDRTVPIRFEDGTELEMAGGTAVRIVESNSKKVKISLTRGKVHASIRGRGGTRWTLEAGPYRVAAPGTAFSVSWDDRAFVLDVSVSKGRVLVHGPGLSESGIGLKAGEQLEADLNRGLLSVESTRAADDAPASGMPPDRAPPDDGRERRKPRPRAFKRTTQKRRVASLDRLVPCRWKQLYERGDYAGALRAAEDAGMNGLISKSSQEELWQLADAARYARSADWAPRILLAIRKRFPDSRRAKLASFLLGRVALELRHDPLDARRWFKTYLKEDPRGPIAEEALGRLIDACKKAGRMDEAIHAAELYLSRYQDGLFSELARSVLPE